MLSPGMGEIAFVSEAADAKRLIQASAIPSIIFLIFFEFRYRACLSPWLGVFQRHANLLLP